MLGKNEIKDIQSLSHKKYRDEKGLFIAEGPKIVTELLELAPQQLVSLYATREWLDKSGSTLTTATVVSDNELERISQLQTPNGVLAVFKKFEIEAPSNSGFALFLDGIQDPGNFGTIIRTADWFGIQHVICTAGCADPYNPKVVQATMASIARVAVHQGDAAWLAAQDRPVIAAVLHGTALETVSKKKDGILVIGNESKGISPGILAIATEKVTIPGKGAAESLNAAVATGILLSHLLS